MIDPGKLKRGNKYNNQELCDIFGCSTQGGMRRAHKTDTLILVSDHVKSIYDDSWVKGILHYTGMGQEGDQHLDKFQNKTLAESPKTNVEVHLFEVFHSGEYTYQGVVVLEGKPRKGRQPDKNGDSRSVWIFPLRIFRNLPRIVDEDALRSIAKRRVSLAKRLRKSPKKLKARANYSQGKPKKYRTSITQYHRDPFVVEYAKLRADGKCELCGKKAPFNDLDDFPYLETHHLTWLAKGGSDSTSNTVALCPNCHRQMHILNSAADREKLREVRNRIR